MTKIMTLICERSCDLDNYVDSSSQLKDMPGCYVVKFPCSGMIQTLMIDAALKNGADGVVVTGCQIGDCYFREGNKMLRERILGERAPGLNKKVDRRRVLGLWLSRLQPQRLLSEVKEFSQEVGKLPPEAKPEPKPAPKPVAKPAAAKPEAESTDEVKADLKPSDKPEVRAEAKPDTASVAEKIDISPETKQAIKAEEQGDDKAQQKPAGQD